MKGNARVGASLLISLVIFALGYAAGSRSRFDASAQDQAAPGDSEAAFAPVREAFALLESNYVDPIAVATLVDGAIAGMASALDDAHSGYIKPALCPHSRDHSGEFSGIGVMIETDEDGAGIRVVSVIPNSPAAAVGVLAGDIFHEVDGMPVRGMSQAELSAIVPGPRGTSVAIVFKRGEALVAFEILRDVFELPNVSYRIVGGDIAYISMLDFHDLSRAQLDDALEALDIASAKGLIFDIRANPGGTLASAIEVGSAFIDDGVLLRQVSRDSSEEATWATGGYAKIDAPTVVLVDEKSASAAEVIAGAMQDHAVATIIGETTYGKGTVQNLPLLSNGGCLRYSARRWLTPHGKSIHERGITPDVIVAWDPENEDASTEDAQLEAAIAYLEARRDRPPAPAYNVSSLDQRQHFALVKFGD